MGHSFCWVEFVLGAGCIVYLDFGQALMRRRHNAASYLCFVERFLHLKFAFGFDRLLFLMASAFF